MPGTGPLYMGRFNYSACSVVCSFFTTYSATHVERNFLDKAARFTDYGFNTILPLRRARHMDHSPGISNLDRACRSSQSPGHHSRTSFGARLSVRCCGLCRTARRSEERRQRRGIVKPHRGVPPGNRCGYDRFGPGLDLAGSRSSSEARNLKCCAPPLYSLRRRQKPGFQKTLVY